MNEVSLNRLFPGERATIRHISRTISPVRQRLLEMGLVRGASIEIIRYAPMGDPIEINVGGYRLSIRRIEAEAVMVDRSPQ